jgi:hypothetical protein
MTLPSSPLHHSVTPSLLLCVIFLLFSTASAQDVLPWKPPTKAAEPILRTPSGPLEILERFDIGTSQVENFISGQSLSPSEEDVLIKILYCFPRLGLDNLQRWRQQSLSFDKIAAAPAAHRGQIFRLAGRAKRVERRPLLPEQKELFEFGHYDLVTIALDNSPYQALVATRKIPHAWPINVPIDEPTAADAMFLKLGDAALDSPPLVFATAALGWYPDRPDEPHHIGDSQLALARLGMDISLWDDIRTSKDHALSSADREGFYQLLHVLGRLPPHSPLITPAASPDLVALLEKPQNHLGEISTIEGVARRIMRIAVNDPDINSRFGLDHYYEIDLFLSLGEASLHFAKSAKDKTGPTYRNAFPATLIARELPSGLSTGENVHELVRAEGVFFKTWAYRSPFASQFNQLQPAPLFITRRPQIVAMQSSSNWLTSALVITAFVLGLAVILIIAFVFNRSDRAARATKAARRAQTLDLKF